MEILAPWAAVAFLAVPAIVGLYILKVRAPQRPVASLPLWPRNLADRQADRPFRRLRPSWLLAVQLLVATALALALIRPAFESGTGAATTTAVLIDGSPSMTATDVAPSRFEAAVARARRLAGQLGPGDQMAVVVMGDSARVLSPPTADQATLRAALKRARPAGTTADVAEGVSAANALLAGRPEGSIVLFSDGHGEVPSGPVPSAAPVTYQSIGASAENLALEALGRTAAGEVFLRIANLGQVAREVQVELRADGRLADVVPLRVGANASAETTWSRLPPGTGMLEARLAPSDVFALDDAAWLVTRAPTARSVLVVTEGNGFLARALGLVPGVKVTVVSPSDYKPAAHDLFVFDGFVPPGPLPQPALVVAPPEGAGPLPLGPAADPGALAPTDPREPLLRYVSLADVHVQSAGTVKAPAAGWRTVIDAAGGPLLLVRQGEPRTAVSTFDLHRSDLPLRGAFPILVRNLVAHLLPAGAGDQAVALGRPVTLGARPSVRAVEVTTPGGTVVPLRGPFPATFAGTDEPGVYSVRETAGAASTTTSFVVQLQDPDASRIAAGPAPLVRATSRPPGEPPKGTLEVWRWVALAALAGLGVESVLFLRG